jgi:hypothetical protein
MRHGRGACGACRRGNSRGHAVINKLKKNMALNKMLPKIEREPLTGLEAKKKNIPLNPWRARTKQTKCCKNRVRTPGGSDPRQKREALLI